MAESVAGGESDFSEVALAALGEQNFQFGERVTENMEERAGNFPLLIRIAGGRKLA